MAREHDDAIQTPPQPHNRDEAITQDEDENDVNRDNETDDDDERSTAYDKGFRAGEEDARTDDERDNPYHRDNLIDHALWQDGYDAGRNQ